MACTACGDPGCARRLKLASGRVRRVRIGSCCRRGAAARGGSEDVAACTRPTAIRATECLAAMTDEGKEGTRAHERAPRSSRIMTDVPTPTTASSSNRLRGSTSSCCRTQTTPSSPSATRLVIVAREEIFGRGLFDVFPDDPSDPAATGTRNLRASLERVHKYRTPHTMAVQKYDIQRPASEGGGSEGTGAQSTRRSWTAPAAWPTSSTGSKQLDEADLEALAGRSTASRGPAGCTASPPSRPRQRRRSGG